MLLKFINKEKKYLTKIILATILTSIPEIMLSWLIGKLSEISMWYIWIGLQLIKFVLWLLEILIGIFLYRLLWKNEVTNVAYASFVKNKYPNPDKYFYYEANDFFKEVMMDASLPWNVRIDAARNNGALENSITTYGFIASRRMEKGLMKAIQRYHDIDYKGEKYQEEDSASEQGGRRSNLMTSNSLD